MRFLRYLLSLVPVLLLTAGCGCFFSDTVVAVEFDESSFPWDRYCPAPEHRIVFPDPGNPGEQEVLTLPPGRMSVLLRIPKGSAVPVAVYSSAGGRPAGGIFPITLEKGNSLRISPEDGFTAGLLLSLLSENIRIEALNVSRLMDVIAEKSAGDPWSIDSELLKTSIVLGSMAEYRIKRMDPADYVFKDLPGTWIPDNPFIKEVRSDPDGSLPITLYPGISGFLNPETREILCIYAEEGRAEYILTGGEICR